MSKFSLIALLALVGIYQLVACAPQAEVEDNIPKSSNVEAPSNLQEISALKGKLVRFSDFCISFRDYIFLDVKNSINRMTARGFSLFFEWADEIGKAAAQVQKEATERFSKQLSDRDAPIDELTRSNGNEVNSVILEGQRKIKQTKSATKSMFLAVGSTIAATRNSITTNVAKKFQEFRKNFGVHKLLEAIDGACRQVETYERELRIRFESAKEQLARGDKEIAQLQIENVPCETTKRLLQLDGFCKLGKVAKDPLLKIWGVTNGVSSETLVDQDAHRSALDTYEMI